MLRLKPPTNERILQTQNFEATYGGAEANVAVSLALLGNKVEYLSKFPENLLGESAINTLRKYGVDTAKCLRGGDRLGSISLKKVQVSVQRMLSMIGLIVHLHRSKQRNLTGQQF